MFQRVKEAQEYLESFIRPTVFERVAEDSHLKDPLDRMRVLLHLLGDPQEKFRSVQVSGTSGKGSTTYLLANILAKAGYKTGLATSPHLQRINERMQIGMEEISDHDLLELITLLSRAVEKMKTLPEGEPSYFELLTALSFMHFANEKVDIAVVEVGLEGKYDATNVLSPLVVIVTNISKDHTELLGNTEAKIAQEALSIVRKGALGRSPVVVTGIDQPKLLAALRQKAKRVASPLKILGSDFKATHLQQTKTGMKFNFSDGSRSYDDLEVILRGEYQVSNASLALAAADALQAYGFHITSTAVREGLATAFFPGRFEVRTYYGRTIILDGAHNKAKMGAFLKALSKYYPTQSTIFVIGFKKNKDIAPMLDNLFAKKAEHYILTQFHKTGDYARSSSMTIEELRKNVRKKDLSSNIDFEMTAPDALQKAMSYNAELIVVTGSLYLVGEMRDILMELEK